MPLGFVISLTLHIALLAWALLSIQQTPQLDIPETVAVSVAIVTPSEVTRMKQGDQNTKTLESKAADKPTEDDAAKEAAKPKAAVAPPPPPPPAEPPPPEPAKAEAIPPPPPADPIEQKLAALPPPVPSPTPPPPPDPGPTPEELAALAAQAEAERVAAEQRQKAAAEAKAKAEAAAKAKAEAAKKAKAEAEKKRKLAEAAAKAKAEAEKKFDPNKLAELINKADDGPQKALIDKSNKPTGAKPTGDSTTATNTGPSAGTKDGRDSVLSAREADMLNSLLDSQLKSCWRLPAGGGGAETPIVVLSWHLKPDGSLDGEPLVLQPQNTTLFQVAAQAAIRAVKTCVPFNLPPEKYSNWRDIKSWAFDPSKML